MSNDLKQQIVDALGAFGRDSLKTPAIGLLNTLGYKSDKILDLDNTPDAFLVEFNKRDRDFRKDKALFERWKSVEFLFQITDDEVHNAQGQGILGFDSGYNANNYRSYIFIAIDLKPATKKCPYTRTRLAMLTREVNRLFSMPVIILIRAGARLSLSAIDRRLHKRDDSKDVLEKVRLLHDIDVTSPHRAYKEILAELHLPTLLDKYRCRDFTDLHAAWGKVLDIEALNKQFYRSIQHWFYWACQEVSFPHGGIDNSEVRTRIGLIRLLTRVIFCWFAREKGLIPAHLFDEKTPDTALKTFDAASRTDGSYYLTFLQNLFFPTLCVPLDQREFRDGKRHARGKNEHYMDHRFFRHEALFNDAATLGRLFADIPFLNGGLFECLDTGTNSRDEIRVDGFSDVASKQPKVPNALFFGKDIAADLSDACDSASMSNVKVDGLFHILSAYKFTIAENTPIEEEIALDPELLGRIFENLLAEYNPETERTARKETGSFYTPRTIVDYMVSESLKAYLERELIRRVPRCSRADARAGLDLLFAYTEKEHPFDDEQRRALVDAVYDVRAFDPACGSGAFPMGMLQKLVFILEKLDHDHRHWKARILEDTPPAMREDTRALLERSSAEHNWKLALIQHSIYGSDIQPIAVQIAKLRCFISLLVDFKVDETAENMGVPSLPNLDFKFVAANSLVPVPGVRDDSQVKLALDDFFGAFAKAAEDYYFVRDPAEKQNLRERIEALIDAKIREREGSVLQRREKIERAKGKRARAADDARRQEAARRSDQAAIERADREIALWESYRNLFAFRNAPVGFFDVRYFFPEVTEGFDITIGNPPYVRADEPSEWNRAQRKAIMDSEAYDTLWEKWDLFVPFIECGYKLLRPGGVSTMIVSDAFCHSKYAQKAQNWFLQNARILRLDFCSDLKIFDAAVHNLIYFFQKADGLKSKPERRLHTGEFGNVKKLPTDQQGKLTYRAFFPEDAEDVVFDCDAIPIGSICYLTYGLAVSSDEKEHKGEFVTEDVTQDTQDARHPKPWVEGKLLAKWLPIGNRWLEWGTKRAPAHFRRVTFQELYEVSEKLLILRVAGDDLRSCYDDARLYTNHTSIISVPWHMLSGVRNRSLKKSARYRDEKPLRQELPRREDLEVTSRRFAVKYLLAVMNSTVAREFLRANRRSNTDLYPDDWKKLPVPDVDAKAQAPIVKLVDKILAARRADAAADIADLEAQVDEMVTALYGIGPGAPSTRHPSAGKVDLKERLRSECIPQLGARAKYFHTRAVRAWLKSKGLPCEDTTPKQYMSELMAGGFIHDAGKGWYSTIRKELVLDAKPVEDVIGLLKEKFPLLRFGCWSTEQVARFAQHTQSKFVVFVHTGKDAMKPVFETLQAEGWNAYLNPGAKEARTVFTVRDKTAVVRYTRTPDALPADHLIPIEEILVELHREAKRLSLMDMGESKTIVGRALEAGRIDMGSLLFAASERKADDLTTVLDEYTIPEN